MVERAPVRQLVAWFELIGRHRREVHRSVVVRVGHRHAGHGQALVRLPGLRREGQRAGNRSLGGVAARRRHHHAGQRFGVEPDPERCRAARFGGGQALGLRHRYAGDVVVDDGYLDPGLTKSSPEVPGAFSSTRNSTSSARLLRVER